MLWFRDWSGRNRSCKHNQIGCAVYDAVTGCSSAMQVGCSTINLARVFCLAVNRSITAERCICSQYSTIIPRDSWHSVGGNAVP
jgi:hypothetical protein